MEYKKNAKGISNLTIEKAFKKMEHEDIKINFVVTFP